MGNQFAWQFTKNPNDERGDMNADGKQLRQTWANIITAKDGDTKDIVGYGGPGAIPRESARVGGYCKINVVHYSDALCTTVSYTE